MRFLADESCDFAPDLTIEDVKACAKYAADIVRSEEVHVRTSSL